MFSSFKQKLTSTPFSLLKTLFLAFSLLLMLFFLIFRLNEIQTEIFDESAYLNEAAHFLFHHTFFYLPHPPLVKLIYVLIQKLSLNPIFWARWVSIGFSLLAMASLLKILKHLQVNLFDQGIFFLALTFGGMFLVISRSGGLEMPYVSLGLIAVAVAPNSLLLAALFYGLAVSAKLSALPFLVAIFYLNRTKEKQTLLFFALIAVCTYLLILFLPYALNPKPFPALGVLNTLNQQSIAVQKLSNYSFVHPDKTSFLKWILKDSPYWFYRSGWKEGEIYYHRAILCAMNPLIHYASLACFLLGFFLASLRKEKSFQFFFLLFSTFGVFYLLLPRETQFSYYYLPLALAEAGLIAATLAHFKKAALTLSYLALAAFSFYWLSPLFLAIPFPIETVQSMIWFRFAD